MAMTVYAPVVLFAVKTDEVTTPFESVVSVSLVFPFANVPLGPDDGAAKVTGMPMAADRLETTTTLNGFGKEEPTVPLCTVALVANIVATTGTAFVVELLHAIEKLTAKQARTAVMLVRVLLFIETPTSAHPYPALACLR